MKRQTYLVLFYILPLVVFGQTPSDTTTNGKNSSQQFNPNLTYGTVTDVEGNKYKTIKIGTQTWMAENLNTSKYANGEPIPPHITDDNEWENVTTGAWCYYNNDSSYKSPYGKLYSWFTVADSRNLCPTGWHLPSDTEWTILTNYLGGDSVAGGKMKSMSTRYWQSPNTDATNSSGFSGVPGGVRILDVFGDRSSGGGWWSSSESIPKTAWYRNLSYKVGHVSRESDYQAIGLSVRCIKD